MTATATAPVAPGPVKRGKAPSNSVAYGTGIVTFLITGEDTGGEVAQLEVTARPGSEPPYHVHEREDETFHLLEGHVSFLVDGRTHEVFAGESIFLPRRVPHTFRIRSESARAILTLTPAGFEEYFRAIGHEVQSLAIPEPAPLPPDYLERVSRVLARCGVRFMNEQPAF